MVAFFDVLLIDDEPVIHQNYKERRRRLKSLITRIKGKADIVWQRTIDFARPGALKALRLCLAEALVQRWEGLVLKPVNEPYFNYCNRGHRRHPSCWVKLKKDCIDGFGDTADVSIIGAGYDPGSASTLRFPNPSWTHFFLACLTNKQEVLEARAKPSFFIFDCVHANIKREDVMTLNQRGGFISMKSDSDEAAGAFRLSNARMDATVPKMSAVFKQPFVCEIAGSGFDKPPNCDIFTLRFARIVKVHWDRDWTHSVSLNDLQHMAAVARTVPPRQSLEHEVLEWVGRLEHLDRGIDGKMGAWLCTDDEEEPHEKGSKLDSVSVASQAARDVRSDLSPPVFQVDSSETTRHERFCGKNQAVRQPASTGFITRNANEDQSSFCGVLSSDMDTKKQPNDKFDPPEQGGGVEMARLPSLAKSPSEAMPRANAVARRRMPLQEIASLMQPTILQGSKSSIERQHASRGGCDKGLKRTIEAVDLLYERHAATRASRKHSTAVKRSLITSPTDCPSAVQTQIGRKAHPTQCPYGSEVSSQFPAPSSADKTSLPDVAVCPIVLSPCLRDRLPDNLFRRLSHLPTKILTLGLSTTNDQTPTSGSSGAVPTYILYLVDGSDAPEVTASSLHKVAHYLNLWHPSVVQIWDWRAIAIAHSPDGGQGWQGMDIASDLFIASMLLVPPHGHDGCSVLVKWADGRKSEALFSTISRLEV